MMTLNLHMERTNYLTYCQYHYNLQEHYSPIGHGWEQVNGKCCHTLPPCPGSLYLMTAQMRVAVTMRGVSVEIQQIQMEILCIFVIF